MGSSIKMHDVLSLTEALVYCEITSPSAFATRAGRHNTKRAVTRPESDKYARASLDGSRYGAP